MRDGKGLVEVEVAHVGTDEAGAGQADLGVHVGTVHIDLSAVVVDDLHKGTDAVLVDAVGRRIGDHEGGQVVLVLLGLGFGVLKVDVAVFVAFHHHHLHTGHGSRSGVGAVSRGGDQADVAVTLTVGLLVATDGEQAGIFAAGTRVGHEAHTLEARDFA